MSKKLEIPPIKPMSDMGRKYLSKDMKIISEEKEIKREHEVKTVKSKKKKVNPPVQVYLNKLEKFELAAFIKKSGLRQSEILRFCFNMQKNKLFEN